jgi:cytochrome c553
MKRWAVIAGLFVGCPASAAPVNVMAESCFACHGTDGQSAGAIPAFSTDSPEDLRKALHDFRSGAREATIMDRIVRGYSEAEIEALVSHFAEARRRP